MRKSPGKNLFKILLIFSAFLPVLNLFNPPADTMLLIYTVFVIIYLSLDAFPQAIKFILIPHWFFFLLLAVASGWLCEVLAWASN